MNNLTRAHLPGKIHIIYILGVDTRDLRLMSPSKRKKEPESKVEEGDQYAKVEPKVLVPFATAPGRLPRQVVVERTEKLYQAFTIEALLDEIGIEWRNPKQAPGSWLPLEAFDNADFESRLPDEWMEILAKSGKKSLRGKVKMRKNLNRHFGKTLKMDCAIGSQ